MPHLPAEAIHPQFPTCISCHRVMIRRHWDGETPEGAVRSDSGGLCNGCYTASRRRIRKAVRKTSVPAAPKQSDEEIAAGYARWLNARRRRQAAAQQRASRRVDDLIAAAFKAGEAHR